MILSKKTGKEAHFAARVIEALLRLAETRDSTTEENLLEFAMNQTQTWPEGLEVAKYRKRKSGIKEALEIALEIFSGKLFPVSFLLLLDRVHSLSFSFSSDSFFFFFF